MRENPKDPAYGWTYEGGGVRVPPIPASAEAPSKTAGPVGSLSCDALVLSWLASNKPPKPGAIHLHCRTCGRFKQNVPRCAGEPSAAALLMTQCYKCNRGDFCLDDYLDMRGQDVCYGQPTENKADMPTCSK